MSKVVSEIVQESQGVYLDIIMSTPIIVLSALLILDSIGSQTVKSS